MIKDGAKNALPQRVKKAVTQTPNTTEEPSDEKSKDTDYKKQVPSFHSPSDAVALDLRSQTAGIFVPARGLHSPQRWRW